MTHIFRPHLSVIFLAISGLFGCANKFHYNSATGFCVNKSGETGHNEGRLGECGRIANGDLASSDFHGQNLKGMSFENTTLRGADFSKSDLENAYFYRSDLSAADFSNSNLKGTNFVVGRDQFPVAKEVFYGARVDRGTVFPAAARLGLPQALGGGAVPVFREADAAIDLEKNTIVKPLGKFDYQTNRVLNWDLGELKNLQFDASENKNFKKVFLGTDRHAAESYLQARVHYIVNDFDIHEPYTVAWNSGHRNFVDSIEDQFVFQAQDLPKYFKALQNFANSGTLEAIASARNGKSFLKVSDSESVFISSPRVGVIALAYSYGTGGNYLSRISTFIHEARHSDCDVGDKSKFIKEALDLRSRLEIKTKNLVDLYRSVKEHPEKTQDKEKFNVLLGAVSESELSALVSETKTFHQRLDKMRSCGMRHADCPKDIVHGMKAACDDLPFGAYWIGGVFETGVGKYCQNCTEREKQLALMDAASSFERVLILKDLNGGKYGEFNSNNVLSNEDLK